jgi:hypothetical protein
MEICRASIGENRDRWMPNPAMNGPVHLQIFYFIGRLMGCAIRTENPLPLTLPSLVRVQALTISVIE